MCLSCVKLPIINQMPTCKLIHIGEKKKVCQLVSRHDIRSQRDKKVMVQISTTPQIQVEYFAKVWGEFV